MKPQNIEESHKQPGWVPLSTFAFVDDIPKKMHWREHLLPFEGADDDLTLPWGVYGTTSLNVLSFFATHQAEKLHKRVVVLSLWYYFEGFGEGPKLPKTFDETSGFLHMGRLSKQLRSQIYDELIAQIVEGKTAAQRTRLEQLTWPELLAKEPALVRRFLKGHKVLNMIVHPVRQVWDKTHTEMVQVGSFKLKRDLIKAAEARYFQDTKVDV
jgi:hypothetical protein